MKNSSQQAILSIHRARQGFVKARTAQADQIWGLLADFGIAIQQGISHVYTRVPQIIESAQYASRLYRALLQDYGMGRSMSRRANAWDNAVMESFLKP